MFILRSLLTAVIGACAFYTVVDAHSTERNPVGYVSIIDEPIIHTPSNRAHALSTFDLTFHLHSKRQRIKLRLSPNHDVIAEGATVTYLAPDGSVRSTEQIDRSKHRVFKGDAFIQHYEGAEWTNVGWARITIHRDGSSPIFEGAFRMDGNHHHIQTRTNYEQTKLAQDPEVQESHDEFMIVWRDSDILPDSTGGELRRDLVDDSSCSADALTFNTQPDHPIYAAMRKRDDTNPKRDTGIWGSLSSRALYGRQIDGTTGGNGAGVNLVSTIGNTDGCPTTRKVALLGVATDCTYTAALQNSSAARANVIQQINTASVQYEASFNITLGLQNLTISDPICPGTEQASAPWNIGCSDSVDIQERLNLFSAWRGNRSDTNAYWTLLSTCNTGPAIGLAWLGQACIQGSSTSSNETVAGANVVVRTSQEWQVIAHETGHTFGAVHDCTSTTCADGQTVNAQQCCPLSSDTCDAGGTYIMNPASGPSITKFSPCSIGNICSALGRKSVSSTCLVANRDVSTITGSQCGNGIVETGEECDCGGVAGCGANSCCDPTTCKLTANAACDPSNEDCCSQTCQFASSGTVCRKSTGVCDPQETCSGTNATCPADVTTPDGTSCGTSGAGLSCSSGQCTSRDLQCRTLMGSYTTTNDTYACSDSGCLISCASPEFGANVCYSMKQNFLDGTTCNGGGKCDNGNCVGSTVGGEISNFVKSNKTLVIGLSVGIGSLVLLALFSCCLSTWRRRRRMAKMPPPAPYNSRRGPPRGNPRGPPPGYGGWGSNIPAPPPMRSSGRWGGPPQGPPPQWNGPSVRYA